MRTTVTLDDDLVQALRQRAHEREQPFKQVLNEVIRAGLNGEPRRREPYRMKPRPLGLRPDIDFTKANKLADALEDEEIIRKMRERR